MSLLRMFPMAASRWSVVIVRDRTVVNDVSETNYTNTVKHRLTLEHDGTVPIKPKS